MSVGSMESAPTPEQSRLTMLLSNAQRGTPVATTPAAAAPSPATSRPPLLTPSFFQQQAQVVLLTWPSDAHAALQVIPGICSMSPTKQV